MNTINLRCKYLANKQNVLVNWIAPKQSIEVDNFRTYAKNSPLHRTSLIVEKIKKLKLQCHIYRATSLSKVKFI